MSLVSIIIPAYNEEKTITEIIRSAAAVDLGAGNSVELLVIDDGSTDRTAALARDTLEVVGGKLLEHNHNRGKGAAFRTGLAAAKGVAVIVQDADLEYDPSEIPKCVAPILADKADVVYGSRRLNKANVAHSSWLFFAGGVLVTSVFNLLYGYKLTDEPTCYKSFRRSVIDALEFSSDGFEWEPEVTARLALKGVPIMEVPISYNPRGSAEGKKITGWDGVKALWVLVRLRFLG
jgi:dolichol-phosphate mannosyltransferase